MIIPEPNLNAPFNIIRLSHVALGVTDLAASRAFYVDMLGLQVTDETDDLLFLRGLEERGHHSLVLRKTDDTNVRSLAFKVWCEEDLDKAHAWFAAKGRKVEWVERIYQGRTLRTLDCFGVPLEFYAQMERLPSIHQKYSLYRGARPLRIDHVNIFAPDVDQAVGFYGEMGFRLTEYTQDADSGRLWAAWMQRKGGVHDIAFTNGFGPRLHHLALWVPNPMTIIDLCDLMATSGHLNKMERGPGRHGISNAFFLYVLDPDGHRIELYCCDYQTLDPDHEPIGWTLDDPQRQTLWGAPAPRSWFENGMNFQDVTPIDPILKATPIIAP